MRETWQSAQSWEKKAEGHNLSSIKSHPMLGGYGSGFEATLRPRVIIYAGGHTPCRGGWGRLRSSHEAEGLVVTNIDRILGYVYPSIQATWQKNTYENIKLATGKWKGKRTSYRCEVGETWGACAADIPIAASVASASSSTFFSFPLLMAFILSLTTFAIL